MSLWQCLFSGFSRNFSLVPLFTHSITWLRYYAITWLFFPNFRPTTNQNLELHSRHICHLLHLHCVYELFWSLIKWGFAWIKIKFHDIVYSTVSQTTATRKQDCWFLKYDSWVNLETCNQIQRLQQFIYVFLWKNQVWQTESSPKTYSLMFWQMLLTESMYTLEHTHTHTNTAAANLSSIFHCIFT